MIEEGLWKIAALLLSVVLLFVVPMYLSFERQDELIRHMIESDVRQTSDKIREIGYVDESLLNELEQELNATGYSYDLELEHLEKRFSEEDGQLKVFYEGTYTEDILAVIAGGQRYTCHIGDFFYIKVVNKTQTNANLLRKLLGIRYKGFTLRIKSGGIVRYGDT